MERKSALTAISGLAVFALLIWLIVYLVGRKD
jgi:hypothetical protein